MLDDSLFDAIVGGFYKAATGEIGWNEALTPVHEAFRTRFAVLQSVDVARGSLVQLIHGGPPLDAGVLDYVRHWHEVDPRRAMVVQDPSLILGRWWHCSEHFDDAFAVRDPFYRHYLPAHGTRYMSTTASMPSPTLMTALAVELPASRGPLSADERHVLERLGLHVADALRAYERVRQMMAQALAGHGLLDAFAYPMWLLDADRFIFYQNPAARAFQLASDSVDSRSGRIAWRSDRIDRRLGTALHALGQGRHGARTIVDARQQLSDSPAWLHLHALVPGRVLGAFGNRQLVLVTLFDPRQMRELDPFALSNIFDMTPTEGKIAVLVAEGLTAQNIASRMGSSVNTVRTHLRRVMYKLGATHLADAVRLLRQGEALWAVPLAAASHQS